MNQLHFIFKSSFQFERSIHTDRGDVKVMSSVTNNAIINYLPPSLALIVPTVANGSPVFGYLVFDETQPNSSMLDFDVIFSPDTRVSVKKTSSFGLLSDGVEVIPPEENFNLFEK